MGQEVKKEAKNWGHLFLCVKPDALVDDFDARPPPSVKLSRTRARVPGDRSAAEAAARVKADELPIPYRRKSGSRLRATAGAAARRVNTTL